MTASKPPELRQRRNRTATLATLEAPPATKVALDAKTPWHSMTVSWWDTIWASPMAREWVDADVPGLIALAALVDAFWQKPDPKVAAEIRMQQREYGLSPMARRSLQWTIQRVESGKPVVPAPTRARDPRLRAVG